MLRLHLNAFRKFYKLRTQKLTTVFLFTVSSSKGLDLGRRIISERQLDKDFLIC